MGTSRSCSLSLLGVLLLVAIRPAHAQNPNHDPSGAFVQKHVLILDTLDVSHPSVNTFLSSLERELRVSGPAPLVVHTRTVVPRRGFEAELAQMADKFASLPLAAVVAFPPLIDAVAAQRDRHWPDTPIVYLTGIDTESERTAGNPQPPNSVAVELGVPPRLIVESAFGLFPHARRVVVVGGASPLERDQARAVAGGVRRLMPGLEVVNLAGLAVPEILPKIDAIPGDSVVLLTSFTIDGENVDVPSQLASILASATPAPLFDVAGRSVGGSVVGSLSVSPERIGSEVGKLLLRLAAGETAKYIPSVRLEPELTLDWRQLERFGVPPDRILSGARIPDRRRTVWERERTLILGVLIAFLLQGLFILILLLERRHRRDSERRLAERLRYEQLASGISAGFADLPRERIAEQIGISLRRIMEFLAVERITLWRYRVDSDAPECLRSITAPGAAPYPPPIGDSVSMARFLKLGNPIRVGDRVALPLGSELREALEKGQIRSVLAIPLLSGGRLTGTLVCDTFTHPRVWPESLVQSLQTLGELFANALALEESERAALAGQALNRAVLASLPGYVAILDRFGVVLRVNDAWTRAADVAGAPAFLQFKTGSQYLRGIDPSPVPPMGAADRLLASVLAGSSGGASVEIRIPGPPESWFEVHIEALQHPEGGAVVSHVDITAIKKVEFHEARNRETIAHMSRVAAVSELASSIAHEVRQPLGAIAINAAALEMELSACAAGAPEVLSAVADIAADAARAGEVIFRMQSLLKKQDPVRVEASLNEVIHKAVRLVARDAGARQVSIRLELAGGRLGVHCDPAQLQQVLINLASNAMDAMAGTPRERRILTIRSMERDDRALMEVEDNGPGIPPGELETIFDAFHTTKPNGLGLGLSVSRKIVEDHNGRLWVENRGGAAFRCLLPFCGRGVSSGLANHTLESPSPVTS